MSASTSPPPHEAELKDDEASLSGAYPVAREMITIVSDDSEVVGRVRQHLAIAGYFAAPPELVDRAWTVVADVRGAVTSKIGDLRRRMRSDAALVAVVGDRNDIGPALQAGAFACVQLPIVEEELRSIVSSATEARSARLEIAEMSRKLDLQSHLATIGRMSAGLTHEISNPLAVAAMSLETVKERAAGLRDRDLHAAIADLEASHARLRDLVTMMKELVGVRPPTLEPIHLRDVVESVRRWGEASALRGVVVETAYEDDVRGIGHRRLAEQILVNFVDNAARAARSLGAPKVRLHVYASRNEVIASVRDNGPGISDDLHERIFEPFFTTRREQGGTGLGLALCREYARQMGARVTMWSALGRGSCFRLHLRRPR